MSKLIKEIHEIDAVNFIFELGQLKRQVHAGWLKIGVKHPVTVAEHVMRAQQIGYIMAIMEGADPAKVVCMLMIHDNAETRIGDLDKVAARYIDAKAGERRAFADQAALLGGELEAQWQANFDEYEERTTKEGIIAKDADWLEQAFQAHEYVHQGYKGAQDWIDNVERALETESAKALLIVMKATNPNEWYPKLKKMTYEKIKK